MKIEIKKRNGETIIAGDFESIKECLEKNRGTDLSGASLEDANLRGINLWFTNLCGANLCAANLQGADLRCADLRGANLGGADLYYTDLRAANLQGADLRCVSLERAILDGANLGGVDLRHANLCGAKLDGAKLEGAKYGDYTLGANSKIFSLVGLKYPVLFIDHIIKIGCQVNTYLEWLNFTEPEIIGIGGADGLDLWKRWKYTILDMCPVKGK